MNSQPSEQQPAPLGREHTCYCARRNCACYDPYSSNLICPHCTQPSGPPRRVWLYDDRGDHGWIVHETDPKTPFTHEYVTVAEHDHLLLDKQAEIDYLNDKLKEKINANETLFQLVRERDEVISKLRAEHEAGRNRTREAVRSLLRPNPVKDELEGGYNLALGHVLEAIDSQS